MLMIQTELEPHPSKLHAEIADLTDGYFDKMQRQVAVYRRDDRRVAEDGSLILASSECFLSGPDQINDRLEIRIGHAQSRLDTFHAMTQTRLFKSIVTEHDRSELGSAWEKPDQWDWTDSGSGNIGINVSREAYPEGNTMYPLMKLGNEKDAIWGMRHQISLDLGFLVMHKSLPLREDHRIEIGLKQRFDKPQPEAFTRHKSRVFVGEGRDVIKYIHRDEHKKKAAAHRDIVEIMDVLAQAKNLRLKVRGVKQEMAFRDRLARQYQEFLAG